MLTRTKTWFTAFRGDDRGFSLAEIIVATTIIGMLVAVLASTLTQAAHGSQQMTAASAANSLMQVEVATVEGAAWTDVMLYRQGDPNPCQLDGRLLATGALSIHPENLFTVDGTDLRVRRNVTWVSDGAPVVCVTGQNDRDDMKKVTIRVDWADPSGKPHTRTTVLLLSPDLTPGTGVTR